MKHDDDDGYCSFFLRIAAMAGEPAGKASFVYSSMETRLMGH